MRDQRLIIEELCFELAGDDPTGRAQGLATQTASALAERLQTVQAERLAKNPDAESVVVSRLRVRLDADRHAWPTAHALAAELEGLVLDRLQGG